MRGAVSILLLAGLLAGAGAPIPAAASPAAAVSRFADGPEAALESLRKNGIEAEARSEIADALAAAAAGDEVRRLLIAVIDDAESDRASPAVLHALARQPRIDAEFLTPLSRLAHRGAPGLATAALGALSSIRTRDAARELLAVAESDRPAGVTAAALDGLARLTGRNDLGRNIEAWREHLHAADRLTEAQWQGLIAEALARSLDRANAERRMQTSRLIDTLRRLHVATPAEERSRLLSSLLLDGQPEVRSLGFELVQRELAAAARLDAMVSAAALTLLRSGEAAVRAQAAILVNQLAPPEAAELVLGALEAERDGGAAAALLAASSRWPDTRLIAPAIRWLSGNGPARGAAAEACWAIYRAGLLVDDDERAQVAVAIRAFVKQEPTTAACQLLSALGDEGDLRTLMALLSGELPGVVAAAEPLSQRPEALDALLEAARAHPPVFEQAARSVLVHRPDAASYAALYGMRAPSAETRRRMLGMVAARMPATDVLRAARDTVENDTDREAVLSVLTSENRILSERESPEQVRAIASGLVMLARLRLEEMRAEEALATLEALPEIEELWPGDEIASIRALAWLSLNRPEMAAETDAPFEAWLRGLEMNEERPFAEALAEALLATFNGRLSDDEMKRVAEIQRRIRERKEAAVAREPPDDPR